MVPPCLSIEQVVPSEAASTPWGPPEAGAADVPELLSSDLAQALTMSRAAPRVTAAGRQRPECARMIVSSLAVGVHRGVTTWKHIHALPNFSCQGPAPKPITNERR